MQHTKRRSVGVTAEVRPLSACYTPESMSLWNPGDRRHHRRKALRSASCQKQSFIVLKWQGAQTLARFPWRAI